MQDSKINTIGLEDACVSFKQKFKNELDFTENLLPKIKGIIKTAYNLDVKEIQLQKCFKLNQYGYFTIIADIYITTEQGKEILIECKNPIHKKSESFSAFGQLMSYEYLLSKTPNKPIIILATSSFEFYLFDFIKQFNLSFDLIINNKDSVGFWLNEFKK